MEIRKLGLSLKRLPTSSSFPSEHLAAVEFGHRFLAGGYPQQCSAGIAEPELAFGIWYKRLAGVDSLSQAAGVLDRAYALAFNRRVGTSFVFIIGAIGIAIGVIAGIAIWVLTRKKK